MPEPRSSPTVGQIVLGLRLKELRERAGRSFDEAARTLRVNATTVRRMEKAEVGLKAPYVEKLLRVYGVDEEAAARFLAEVDEANKPGWWHELRDVLPSWSGRYLGLEQEASLIRSYEPHCVPGLLQTPAYARALLRASHPHAEPAELDRRVELRMRRQRLLDGEDGQPAGSGPRVWSVLDEQVLRRRVGEPEVMRGQVDRLIEVCTSLPQVTVQIVPFSAGAHPAMFGPFQLFRFDIPELPDIVYTESLTGAAYLDQRRETAAYLEALDRLGTLASPADETPSLLRALRRDL